MSGWRKRQIQNLGNIVWTQTYQINPKNIAKALVEADFMIPEPEITDFTEVNKILDSIKNKK
jgi:hypothetical protein